MNNLVGQIIDGRYEIVAFLDSSGGMDAYKAKDRRLKRFVTLKVVPGSPARNEQLRARFEDKVRAAAQLDHPNIAQVYAFNHTRSHGVYYIATQFIPGVSLDNILSRGRRLSLKQALYIIEQIGQALKCAHGHGITHGDIRPANVIIDKKRHVLLAGFGLGPDRPTSADIGALGNLFYEMVAGETSDLPPEIEAIIERMRAERYPSAAELLADLARYKRPKKAKPPRRSNLWLVAAGIMIVFTVVMFIQLQSNLANRPTDRPTATVSTPVWRTTTAEPDPDEEVTTTAPPPSLTPTHTDLPVPTAAATYIPRIAFTSDRDGDYEIYVVDTGGENLQQLTQNSRIDAGAKWSPDGTQLVYFACRTFDGPCDIMRLNTADGSTQRLAGGDDTANRWPAWSPDGAHIAFASNRDGDFEIYVMDIKGEETRQLTDNQDLIDTQPAWSPDGETIVYVSGAGDDQGIYTVPATGGAPAQLLDSPDHLEQFPIWSPDGAYLAFQSDFSAGNTEIWLFDPATGRLTNLTANPAADEHPAWSPDGKQIAFISTRDGDQPSVYILSITGEQAVRRLTGPDFFDGWPAWSPR